MGNIYITEKHDKYKKTYFKREMDVICVHYKLRAETEN